MSTNIYDAGGIQVTRFACGKCGTDGPCFQVTGDGYKGGDFVIVHRAQAHDAAYAILHDMHKEKPPDAEPCGPDHRGAECKCCHVIMHCCPRHCCCFYRCVCRHAPEHHVENGLGKCAFDDSCGCKKYQRR